MKKNITKILSIFMLSALVVTGCSAGTTVTTSGATIAAITTAAATMPTTTTAMTTTPTTTTAAKFELTVAELAKFNGKNGQPAYVAIDGIIYDVTNDSQWVDGQHKGFMAGKDLSVEIKSVSHGMGVFEGVPQVGTIKK